MEIPAVLRRLGLASTTDVWLRQGQEVVGRLHKTADENVWQLLETEVTSGKCHWTGLILVSAEDKAAEAALEAISKGWADAEKVEENSKPLKYCGFEKEIGPGGDSFLISQRGIQTKLAVPHFRPSEDDEVPAEAVNLKDIKTE